MSIVEVKCQNYVNIGPDPELGPALHELPCVFLLQCPHGSCVNTHKGPDLKQTLMKVIIHCPTNSPTFGYMTAV